VVPRETNGHLLCEQHLFGNPAKVPEGALDTGKPTLPALVAKRPDPRLAHRFGQTIHREVGMTVRFANPNAPNLFYARGKTR
jgi:hypothetical protein